MLQEKTKETLLMHVEFGPIKSTSATSTTTKTSQLFNSDKITLASTTYLYRHWRYIHERERAVYIDLLDPERAKKWYIQKETREYIRL